MRRGFVALLVALALGGAGCDVNQTTPQGDPSHDPNIQQTDHGLLIKNSAEMQRQVIDAVNRHVISQQRADATLSAYNVTLSQTGDASKATMAANNELTRR
ncbi:MAG: hypothetical protein E6G01_05320 [Actinobacteria bacterium]|nr:MAG: hypothetical protein E6G01_05320 [Actinomycetota bacterium]